MGKHPAWFMALLTLLTFMVVVTTGCEAPAQAPGPVGTTEGPSVVQRWESMTDEEEKSVCAATSGPLPGEGEIGGAGSGSQSDGVDYRKVLWELEAAGFTQVEATAMIPYALKQCR